MAGFTHGCIRRAVGWFGHGHSAVRPRARRHRPVPAGAVGAAPAGRGIAVKWPPYIPITQVNEVTPTGRAGTRTVCRPAVNRSALTPTRGMRIAEVQARPLVTVTSQRIG